MTFPIFNQIADAFYQLFGTTGNTAGFMLTLIILSVIIILLLAVRAGKVVIVMILAPLIVVISTQAASKFLGIPRWIAVMVWLVMGFLFASVYWTIMR